jgi:hypothetical protein
MNRRVTMESSKSQENKRIKKSAETEQSLPVPIKTGIDVSQFSEMPMSELVDVLALTIKHDDENKLITFLCMLSAYTDTSQLNVSFNAPSSSGKTYITGEIAKLFPQEDKIELSGASPTSFFHGEGKIDKERNAKLVSLERKILIFYEQPNPALQEKLRPVLSHDARELNFRITDKDKKGAHRAVKVIIRGYPATVFCSAGLKLDEQEATRALLLSPQITEDKIKTGVHLQAMRGADEIEFDKWIEAQPERIALKKRIIAIREQAVMDIKIPSPEQIEARFKKMFGKLKPRHMRDIAHLIKLIKAVALLNVWHRSNDEGIITANIDDVDNAFKLWGTVIESQDMNVPPVVMAFYKQYVLPAFYKKQENSEYSMDMQDGRIGLSNRELTSYYLDKEERALNDENLRKQILPQLENSGMISIEQPSWGDKRSKHIFPKYFPDAEKLPKAENYVGEGSGVFDDLDQETMEMFFGSSSKDK